jgi:ribosomal protein S1
VGDIVKGKVVRLVPFGAFVELEKGVDGLVHISQISDKRIGKPDDVLKKGQEVEAKVLDVNESEQRISLSIREVNPINPPKTEEREKPEKRQKAEKQAKVDKPDDKEQKQKPAKKAKAQRKEESDTANNHREDMTIKIGDMLGNINLEDHVQEITEEKVAETVEEPVTEPVEAGEEQEKTDGGQPEAAEVRVKKASGQPDAAEAAGEPAYRQAETAGDTELTAPGHN